jgi:mono/diheme cytochrome c family protein
MKKMKHTLLAIAAAAILYACSPAGGNHPGSEYMPDMGHSVAVEPNVYSYYYHNTWDSASTIRLKELSYPGLPVEGTVPRGFAGVQYAEAQGMATSDVLGSLRGGEALNSIAVPINGSVPYYYGDTEDERLRATAEIIANPFPITAAGLERGKELYNIFCGICHGEKGDGVGYLVSEENRQAKYPAAPANFLLDEFLEASNGRYYHSIMYGKNVMGAYKDKISYEERWQVIHWIRALQAKEKKLEYNEQNNTLNARLGTPASQMAAAPERTADAAPQPEAAPEAEERTSLRNNSTSNNIQGRK